MNIASEAIYFYISELNYGNLLNDNSVPNFMVPPIFDRFVIGKHGHTLSILPPCCWNFLV